MKRHLAVFSALLALAALMPVSAAADFGLKGLSFELEDQGAPLTKAGTHHFEVTTKLEVNSEIDPELGLVPDDAVKDLAIRFPPGLVGNPTAVEACSNDDFTTLLGGASICPDEAIIGKVELVVGFTEEEFFKIPLYNLDPPPGIPARVGFVVLGVPVTIDVGVNPDPPYNLISTATNASQAIRFYGVEVSVWGDPASASHDKERGQCVATPEEDSCPVEIPEKPFLTAPRSCTGPMQALFETDSWQQPGSWLEYPVQLSSELSGCEDLLFEPEIQTAPTTPSASSASGLRFDLDIEDKGLVEEDGTAGSDIKKAEVLMPEGFTLNPSAGEGLEACSEADLERETPSSEPGDGCPQASKVGTVEVETPILEDKILEGEVFVATQDQNPFGSMIALYMVIKDPELGVIVKQPGRVELDPVSGQVKTTFGEEGFEIPQFPFSHLRFRFNEGKRAPLVTPPACGSYEVKATFTPWANPSSPITKTSDLNITSGPGGGPCPSASPFDPSFLAGSIDSTAGAYSPFYMRLARGDSDQNLTRFTTILPPGLTGKIAGLGRCPDAAIEAAKQRSGRMEAALPSCPGDSKVGQLLGGAGVGSELTWVPGSVYLAGPFDGDPISIVAIAPGVVGPFDVGTVVARVGLDVDPESAEVKINDSASDLIPQILKGIPVRLRDLRVNVDRPDFTLNPTSCEVEQTRASLFGSGGASAERSSRYQASSCAALKFKPKLKIALKGGTKRTEHPELRSVLRPRPGDANIGKATIILPPTIFIDNAHISNPCTRVQFNANACPKGSVLGHARAFTPILDEPLEGPVYFRSNGGDRELPDVVADLHGLFHVIAVGWVDSVKGRTRTRFQNVPDAPISKFVLNLKGGKEGLLQNSANLCVKKRYVDIRLTGQNGRRYETRPVVGTSCKGKPGRSR